MIKKLKALIGIYKVTKEITASRSVAIVATLGAVKLMISHMIKRKDQ